MKRLLWKVVMLVVVFVPCSYADSFQITQVTGSMDPRTGQTFETILFTFTGPGTTFQAFGAMQCYPWCYNDQGLQPDTSTSIGEVFVTSIFGPGFGPVILGGKTYNVAGFDQTSFFSTGGALNPSVVLLVDQGAGLKEAELTLPQNGGWTFHFDYIPPHDDSPGGYLFNHGEFYNASPPTPVPEPGTLGLMATGLAGITGLIRRKRLICGRRPN
ncbi:MAG: PEP-CTERM sorting domain-containing protein [Terriglobales bacterium]